MNLIIGNEEPLMPAYTKEYHDLIAYAIGNRNIGLLFGQRMRLSMLWKMQTTVKSEIVLVDELDAVHILGTVRGMRNLSFTFDPFSYPIVALEINREDFVGVEVYKFTNSGGDETEKQLLLSLPNCRTPKLLPTNISDLGSVLNQPLLVYIDETGSLAQRSMKTNFTKIEGNPMLLNLGPTDTLRRVGITTTGKIQVEVSSLKKTL